MSTRANIEFTDNHDSYMVDCSHDGFPYNVLPEIKEAIDRHKRMMTGPELGQLVSTFLGMNYDNNKRVQNWEPCNSKAGDESYLYYVTWEDGKSRYDGKFNVTWEDGK